MILVALANLKFFIFLECYFPKDTIIHFTVFVVFTFLFIFAIMLIDWSLFMMQQTLPECPVEITMGLIGDKWKILIIRDLLTGTKRFGELKKSLTGISQKVLTNNLRDMEKSGLVHREVFAEVPPRVEYSLTDTGWSLKSVLYSMVEWGNNYREMQK